MPRKRKREAYEIIKEQFHQDLEVLKRLAKELCLSVPGSELLRYSGLTVGEYTVRERYRYYKLMGVLTGSEAGEVKKLLVRKEGEAKERKRNLRRKTEHLLNLRKTVANAKKLSELIKYWRRTKALQKWLKEFEKEG